MELFIILLTIGIIMVCAEIFLPGGILGLLGGLALLGAAVAGFAAFGPVTGGYLALGILIGSGAVIVAWIRIFPRTGAGKALTLAGDMAQSKATDGHLRALAGQAGTAATDLRPAGIARIANRNYDVVSEGALIPRGATVTVLKVQGNRIIVRRTAPDKEKD